MRILTVRQPWAWAIIHGGKDVENRVRNIAGDYRGPVAIHAAASWDWDTKLGVIETPHPTSVSQVRGAIIGVVDLVDVHVARDTASGTLVDWADGTKPGELCSPWAVWYHYHLVLRHPRPLSEPIPFRGALGLRRLDGDMVARIEASIA